MNPQSWTQLIQKLDELLGFQRELLSVSSTVAQHSAEQLQRMTAPISQEGISGWQAGKETGKQGGTSSSAKDTAEQSQKLHEIMGNRGPSFPSVSPTTTSSFTGWKPGEYTSMSTGASSARPESHLGAAKEDVVGGASGQAKSSFRTARDAKKGLLKSAGIAVSDAAVEAGRRAEGVEKNAQLGDSGGGSKPPRIPGSVTGGLPEEPEEDPGEKETDEFPPVEQQQRQGLLAWLAGASGRAGRFREARQGAALATKGLARASFRDVGVESLVRGSATYLANKTALQHSLGGIINRGEATGTAFTPSQMQQVGLQAGYEQGSNEIGQGYATDNEGFLRGGGRVHPFNTGFGFQIPFVGPLVTPAGQAGLRSTWESIKLAGQPNVTLEQAGQMRQASNQAGFFGDAANRVSERLLAPLVSQYGLSEASQGAYSQLAYQTTRTGAGDLNDVSRAIGDVGAAARAAKMGVDEFAQAQVEYAESVQQQGGDLLKGAKEARNRSTATGLDPQTLAQLNENPLVQSMTMGQTSVLPEAQGILAGTPARDRGMYSSVKMLDQVFANINKTKANPSGDILQKDPNTGDEIRTPQGDYRDAMVASQLGLSTKQLQKLRKQGERAPLGETIGNAADQWKALAAGKDPVTDRKISPAEQKRRLDLIETGGNDPGDKELSEAEVARVARQAGIDPKEVNKVMAIKDPTDRAKGLEKLYHDQFPQADTKEEVGGTQKTIVDLTDRALHYLKISEEKNKDNPWEEPKRKAGAGAGPPPAGSRVGGPTPKPGPTLPPDAGSRITGKHGRPESLPEVIWHGITGK